MPSGSLFPRTGGRNPDRNQGCASYADCERTIIIRVRRHIRLDASNVLGVDPAETIYLAYVAEAAHDLAAV